MTELTADDCSVSYSAAEQPLEVSNVNSVEEDEGEDEDLHKLLVPNVIDLPSSPPSAVEANFMTFFAPDFMKPGHDQYVHRHANGLCVIGLASSHVVFKDEGGVTAVDFNVGKSDRSGIKVTGKRKKGCDASVLLNSKGKNKAEKDGPPNISLHAFYVIDEAKKEVEALCPGTVSCADILALAARDAVTLSGGPTWEVPKGRKDGRISKASETRQLPFPTFNISQLQQSFSQRGLSMDDLVALSGGHTLGFSHCSSFQNRIHNFDKTHDVDPALQSSFAASLRNVCPVHNKVKNAGATMDSSTTTFDNTYYKLLLQGKSLFSSDQSLVTTTRGKALVSQFASSQAEFDKAFVNSMIKMSSITGGQEIRLDCRVVR